MNLNFKLAEEDLIAAQQAVGKFIVYCVPADLSLSGRRMPGYLVIGQDKWAYVENGEVRESRLISEC